MSKRGFTTSVVGKAAKGDIRIQGNSSDRASTVYGLKNKALRINRGQVKRAWSTASATNKRGDC